MIKLGSLITCCGAMMNLFGSLSGALAAPPAAGFDITEFALPNTPADEIRFETPRDIQTVVLTFKDDAPTSLGLSYLHKTWPETRTENYKLPDQAFSMGWFPLDDQTNSTWREAAINIERADARTAIVTFKGLTQEFPEYPQYDVTFRRTLGLKFSDALTAALERVQIYTTGEPTATTVRVMLDAGKATPGREVSLAGYNARIERVTPVSGATVLSSQTLALAGSGARVFEIAAQHMKPALTFSADPGLLTFALAGGETFTISLDALAKQGPVWFEDQGVYVTDAADPTTFEQYKVRIQGETTITKDVMETREQTLDGARNGQPRPHPDAFQLACKRARQRFWLEPTGDLGMVKENIRRVKGRDTARYKAEGDVRFSFGLDSWNTVARIPDRTQVADYTIQMRKGDLELEQTSLAAPLLKPADTPELAGDDSIVAMLRFRFFNAGDTPCRAELPIHYSDRSGRSYNRYVVGGHYGTRADDRLIPLAPNEPLSVTEAAAPSSLNLISSRHEDAPVLRAGFSGSMTAKPVGDGLVLSRELQPGEQCEVLLKVPFIELNTPEELAALEKLDFDASRTTLERFWRVEKAQGARLTTPEARCNMLHAAHVAHVQFTDFAMPGDQELINTSVGTSTYANYCNESCMIIQDLDERGLHEEARRRLAVWLKYQGTEGLRGNYTDFNGVFYGSGGFGGGDSYNQHHGWVLWCLANHYFMTGDDAWLKANADAMIKGADWVFRQRQATMKPMPASRGWEQGFLPAGGLEDVNDYFFWLTTNAMTWRGTEWTARALEAIHHPEAARVRRESDAYKHDLIAGFEKSRQMSPLVRLRDGRWIPNYPSRLYQRGRDIGWVRELLEGSVYLILSGLYEPTSKEAGWILEDFQDNRYPNPDYTYPVSLADTAWFDVGGFSCQPNLLPGLMPYLDTDQPEVYIRMLFNAFVACYHEEVGAMAEHPMPLLGYSNSAGVKTSDQSNVTKWLRYMFVYSADETLYLGRAIPRAWFASGEPLALQDAVTPFGTVSVNYQMPVETPGLIRLEADLALRQAPGRIVARMRHPNQKPIQSVTVNGEPFTKFDARKGDIDLTGRTGKLVIEARYDPS